MENMIELAKDLLDQIFAHKNVKIEVTESSVLVEDIEYKENDPQGNSRNAVQLVWINWGTFLLLLNDLSEDYWLNMFMFISRLDWNESWTETSCSFQEKIHELQSGSEQPLGLYYDPSSEKNI